MNLTKKNKLNNQNFNRQKFASKKGKINRKTNCKKTFLIKKFV